MVRRKQNVTGLVSFSQQIGFQSSTLMDHNAELEAGALKELGL